MENGHPVAPWWRGGTAEAVQRLLQGSPVALEGRLVHRSWRRKGRAQRYVTDRAERFDRSRPKPESRP